MKTLLRVSTLALTTLFSAATFHAQAPTPPAVVTSGSLTLTLNTAVFHKLAEYGVTTTYIQNTSTSTSSATFSVDGGLVDLTDGSSEVQSTGGVEFASPSKSMDVRIERLALESMGSDTSVVTALIVVNGTFQGRQPVFTITEGHPGKFPKTYGTISSGPINFEINPDFFSEINDYFDFAGSSDFGGQIGQVSTVVSVSPQ